MSIGLDILRVLTVITAILLNVSPWPDYRRIIRDKDTGPLSMLPLLMLFVNSYVWSMYAYLVGNFFPLFSVCAFGGVTCIVFLSIYYRWSTERTKLHKMLAAAAVFLAAWTIYVVLATAGVTGQSNDSITNILGYMCVVVNIAVYAAPLDVMKTVVKTKNAEALPISLCSMYLINGVLWVVFGAATSDFFVVTPNALGSVLSAVQVALYFKYRPRGIVGATNDVMDTKGSVAIVISPKNPGAKVERSPAYHQVRSPQ